MFGIRLTRILRRRIRVAAVWAAVPLVVFNGRTINGCGCSGHFEAVCHCACCSDVHDSSEQLAKTCCSCCGSHAAGDSKCCCCRGKPTKHCDKAADTAGSANGRALERHQCKRIALYNVLPVTAVPSFDAGGLHSSLFVLADVTVPVLRYGSHVGTTVDFDTGPPPDDLVVTLHRLII
jgi:hypothetical protein